MALFLNVDPGQYHRAENDNASIEKAYARLKEEGISIDWLEHGIGDYKEEDESAIKIPISSALSMPDDTTRKRERVIVVDEPAFASYTLNKKDPVYIRSLPTEELPLDLQVKGSNAIIKIMVSGESMRPTFNNGEFVYCSKFEYSDELDFQYKIMRNKVYIVVVKGRDPMLKRIGYKAGSEYITCFSDNEDQEMYPPFKVQLSDIEEMWYVERKYGGQFEAPKWLQLSQYESLPDRVRQLEDQVDDILKGVQKLLKK